MSHTDHADRATPGRWTVLTLDQRGSRGDADAVPVLLETLRDGLPRPPALAFERTVGDEAQGLLDDPVTALEVVARVLRLGGWSIGIGLGAVELPLPEGTRAGRGEAFVRAREAVERAKTVPHRLCVVGGPGEDGVEHLETVLWLWAGLLERRTPGGWEVHDLVRDGLSYAAAGQRLGITQSAVSQRAQVAGLVDERRARRLASDLWTSLVDPAAR